MGDDHQRRGGRVGPLEQQVHHRRARHRVEVAGRFVGEQQRRARPERARDRDALLLAARQLRRIMVEPMAEPDRLQLGLRRAERIVASRQFHRHRDIFQRGHRRQQVKGLEHDPDPPAPRLGEPVLVQRREVLPDDVTAPPLARSSPLSTAISDDLPDPLAPRIASRSPRATSRSIPRRISVAASRRPSVRVTLRAGIIISVIAADMGEDSANDRGSFEERRWSARSCRRFCWPPVRTTPRRPPRPPPRSRPRPPPRRVRKARSGWCWRSATASMRDTGSARGRACPTRLASGLREAGINATLVNAGVSGDTSAAGRQRLAFTLDGLARAPDLVILGLGGNDALRQVAPAQTRAEMTAMMEELKRRGIPVLLTGMRAPRNLGPDYAAAFNSIWPDLAKQYGAGLYPFILNGVITEPALMQRDGVHPTAAGVQRMADALAPLAIKALPPARS